jgi:hypothetical protein
MDMRKFDRIPAALVCGAISGAVILGIFGRLATATLAMIYGQPTNISLRGILEVVAVGAAAGTLGGVLIVMLRKVEEWSEIVRGVVAGLILFLASLFFALIRGRISIVPTAGQFFSLIVIAVFFLLYGVLVVLLIRRFERN